ncbi:MAG: hypothetical protein JW716_04785 [Candidatus Aenigmarchaeota archaeon]|nr:hypothetical protein [Candidatus Aenigmarchaeota archaeon]
MPAKVLFEYNGGKKVIVCSEAGQYQDAAMCQEIYKSRFSVQTGSSEKKVGPAPMYCTAVTPDFEKKVERGPHDERAIHVASVNKHGKILYALSLAVDNGETHHGARIGVPLENRYKSPLMPDGSGQSYEESASLDAFREKYARLNEGSNAPVADGRVVELFRHHQNTAMKTTLAEFAHLPKEQRREAVKRSVMIDFGDRLMTYGAAFKVLCTDPVARGQQPADLWVWDAIPNYAKMYAVVGGVFRDFTLKQNGNGGGIYLPTRMTLIKEDKAMDPDGAKPWKLRKDIAATINGGSPIQVSRNLQIFHPDKDYAQTGRGVIEKDPMLDGLVPTGVIAGELNRHPISPFRRLWGYYTTVAERQEMRGAIAVVTNGHGFPSHRCNPVVHYMNKKAKDMVGVTPLREIKTNGKI